MPEPVRNVRCNTLADVRSELSLLSGAVETSGNWSWYQILSHLAERIEFSMKGYPYRNSEASRFLLGRPYRWLLFRRGYMKHGAPNRHNPKKRQEGDEVVAMKRLLAAICSFESHTGRLAEHPMLGKFTQQEWTLFHSWHSANHLSFVKPIE